MSERTVLVHRGTFAVLDGAGDAGGARGRHPNGFFSRDARHLSVWRLDADDAPLVVLSPGVLVPEGTRDRPPAYAVLREQAVGASLLAERVRLVNHTAAELAVRVSYRADADFADQFELRADDRDYPKPGAHRSWTTSPGGVRFEYRRGEWRAATEVRAEPAPEEATACGEGVALSWTLRVPAHGSAVLTLNVHARHAAGGEYSGGRVESVTGACSAAAEGGSEPEAVGAAGPSEPRAVREAAAAESGALLERARDPRGLTDSDALARACEQGLSDLAALGVQATGAEGEAVLVPGAGVPWFLTLFGRDPLLASYFALPFMPEPAAATLTALAAAQGERHDPRRLEEPGKIVHEVRLGELSAFGQVPYARYYGTVDATPLFLVLLHAYTEQTGDTLLAARLEHHARAAAAWLFGGGGLDRHGYLVYTPDPSGLANQCWKDSYDGVCTREGIPAAGTIAVCEAQGYAYDALRRTARLAERVWRDPAYARRLDAAAGDLRARFRRDFPLASAYGFPALALDGDRAQVDALSSNAGHLLWSGILEPDEASVVGRRLLEDDFFSGWGVRTLAAGQPAYHPLSYHRGSVWPHDNAVIALGLARYGLRGELDKLTRALVGAAVECDHRLPELLAGYPRGDHPRPIVYPHSCSPQAWSTTAPLALLAAQTGTAR